MSKKTEHKFLRIILYFILATMFFVFQSCRRDRSDDEQLDNRAISAIDNDPSWSPDGTRIVFFSQRDNNQEIYVMNADGTNQIRLTDNPASDAEPSWSPDGQNIVFASDRNGNSEIYKMNADGSNQARLTDNPANENFPSWSADGERIVFQSNRDGNMDIYSINVDGTELTRLTIHPAPDALPACSPDGQKIAFISARDRNSEIYTMNSDGSDQRRLTDNPTMDLFPSWSPDSRLIAFNSIRDGDGDLRIYTMNADGSNQTRVSDEPYYQMYSSRSPDGMKIAFASARDFDMEIYVMDVDGSNWINLTNNAPANEAVGSAPMPRSELDLKEIPYKLVFESYRETDGKENWEICQIDANGSNFINLTNTPEIDEMYPHASPDGRRICFVADEGENLESKRRNVYYMNIDGSNRVKIAENAYQPCWSGDGKYIAYLPGEFPRYNPDMMANKGLEIFNLETGEAKRHLNDEILHRTRLCWSPGGEWFVTTGRAFKSDSSISMSLSAPGCTPDIDPGGTRLVWNGTDNTLHTGSLDLDSPQFNVTDHKIVIVCERDYWIYHADWSPDEKYLAFSYAPSDGNEGVGGKAAGSNICICDFRTGKWVQVTTDGKHNKEPDWIVVTTDGL